MFKLKTFSPFLKLNEKVLIYPFATGGHCKLFYSRDCQKISLHPHTDTRMIHKDLFYQPTCIVQQIPTKRHQNSYPFSGEIKVVSAYGKETARKDESRLVCSGKQFRFGFRLVGKSCLAKLVRKLFRVLTFVNIFMYFRQPESLYCAIGKINAQLQFKVLA